MWFLIHAAASAWAALTERHAASPPGPAWRPGPRRRGGCGRQREPPSQPWDRFGEGRRAQRGAGERAGLVGSRHCRRRRRTGGPGWGETPSESREEVQLGSPTAGWGALDGVPPPGTSHVGKHFLLKKPTPSCSRSRRRVRVPPRAADGQAPHSAFQRGARGPRRPCGHTRTSTPTLPRPEARALPTYSSASTLKTQRGNQSDFIENYAMCNSRLETTDAPSPPVRARFDLNSPSHSGTMC